MKNSINWFEIPVENFDRAVAFYQTVLDIKIGEMPFPEGKYAVIAYDQEGVGGGLVKMEGYKPSADGTLVYLNGGDDLSVPLARVERAGGKVVLPKTSIGGNGYMAHFIDTEGNRLAFHSMN